MGFRYRKSINLGGGVRLNLSKSGIGYSWGTKGYRVTKTAKGKIRHTASIPGTGISYVTESGKKNKQNSMREKTDTTVNSRVAKNKKVGFLQTPKSQGRIRKLLKFVVGLYGILFIIYGGIILITSETFSVGIAIGSGIFLLLGTFIIYLILKSRRNNKNDLKSFNTYQEEKPQVIDSSIQFAQKSKNDTQLFHQQQIQNEIRILKDCLNIMEKTDNIDTFISRFDLAVEKATNLKMAREIGLITEFPSDFLLNLCAIKEETLPRVFMRSFEKESIKVDELKTSKGKINRWKKYYDNLLKYENGFTLESVCDREYKALRQKVMNEILMLGESY